MMRAFMFVIGTVLLASSASAQMPGGAGGQTIGLAASLQRSYAGIKQNLTEAADKMADADYGYRPSPEIRPYGGQFGHVANAHYGLCSALKGEANPMMGKDLEKLTTKPEFVKALADSFAYCDGAVAALTDENALQMVKQGPNQIARAAVVANLIAHDNEEYGVVGVYLRTKSMVPPSTERMMRGRGGR